MAIESKLREETARIVQQLYGSEVSPLEIVINYTRKEFEGDLTVVVFPFTKIARQSPEATGNQIGEQLQANMEEIATFNVIKGFLNLSFTETWWLSFLQEALQTENYGFDKMQDQTVVLEYCGPNTNKPLHLGHIRNMVLGYACANLLEAVGNEVHKVNIYNDRGIAICKSMAAWLRNGDEETPESTGEKGDHLVGKFYVEYDSIYEQEVDELVAQGYTKEAAQQEAPIYKEAQELLRKWEAEDEETLVLWRKMNNWVYQGFEQTYDRLGVDFDQAYYESETWQKGKELVQEGLDKGVFYQQDDGSVWVDLTDAGLDNKLLLRSDGTSVYITQDLGTAELRYEDYGMDRSIYVVANEQDYHFQVLKETLKKLGKPYAEGIYHLSYGMVDLPTGKMKSREGTVVDADELIDQMIETAKATTQELGKIDEMSQEDAEQLYRIVGLGALKFFIIRVDPQKRMLFNPEESIDFQGQTGPFVQYTYARIQSVFRKAGASDSFQLPEAVTMEELEKELLVMLYQYPDTIKEAGENIDPSMIANYVFNLAKLYNKFYGECPILKADDDVKAFRIALSDMTARVIKSGFNVLGIDVPERM